MVITVNVIRELVALARSLDGEVVFHYSGDLYIDRCREPGADGSKLGEITLVQGVEFCPADNDGPEGWEEYSRLMARGLKNARIMLASGDVVSVDEARRLAAEKVVGAGGIEPPTYRV